MDGTSGSTADVERDQPLAGRSATPVADPDYTDDEGRGWWESASGTVRSDPTGQNPTVHLPEIGYMTPEAARRLGQALIGAADYAQPGGSARG